MKKIINWLDNYLEEAIMVIFLIAMTCVMMLQVVMRYFFKSPLIWPEEFCRYCFVASVMFATGYCIRKGTMLRVDVVINLFPKKVALGLDIFSKVIALAFCLILIKPSFQVMTAAQKMGQLSPSMQMPIVWLYALAPVGFILGAFRSLQSIVISVRDFSKNAEEGGKKE